MRFWLAGATAIAALPAPAQAPVETSAAAVLVAQFGERSSAARGSLFERPTLAQPGSLFRPRSYRLGPHYEPPPVVYEPPPVTYRPPSVAERTVRGRCVPRTRAWYRSCAARFRSFDPNRGTYTSFAGEERPCRCP